MSSVIPRSLVALTFAARSLIRVLAIYWFLGRSWLPDLAPTYWFAAAGVWSAVTLANAYTTLEGSFRRFGSRLPGRRLRLAEVVYALLTAGIVSFLVAIAGSLRTLGDIATLLPLIAPEIMLLGRADPLRTEWGWAVHLPFLPLLRVAAAAEGTRVEVDEAPGNGWTCVSKFTGPLRLPIYLMCPGENFHSPSADAS